MCRSFGFLVPIPMHVWVWVCCGGWWCASHRILKNWQSVQEFDSILTPHTSRWYQILQVKSSVPQDQIPPTPPLLQKPVASSNCYLCFWVTGYRLEVPTIPSLDFRCQPQIYVVTCNFWKTGYKSEVITTLHWVWLIC